MKTLLFLSLFMISHAWAKVSELKSYSDIDLTSINSNTLVVFDIDNTLIRQDQMIGTHQWGDYMKARAIKKGMTPEAAGQLQHKAFAELQSSVSVVPVEESAKTLLQYLQVQNIPHFALTARPAVIMNITLEQIEILNHDFSKGFPEQIDTQILESYLHEGVIFSGETPKGELLKKIIANSKIKPNKIVFIDDRKYNLDSVETSLEGMPFELVSLRYGAADPIVATFNSQIADLEYSFFKVDGILISDTEAASLIGHVDRVVRKQFNNYTAHQGPLLKQGECANLNEPKVEVVTYRCEYIYDGIPSWIDFSYDVAANGEITFGDW